MLRKTWPSTLLAMLVLGLAGCGSKDSIALSANVHGVSLTVEQKALGAALVGSFELYMELGSEASGGTQVSLEAFALVRGADTVLAPLPAAPVGATFPLSLGKGQNRTVTFDVSDSALLDQATRDALCAGPLRLRGALTDTLGGGTTAISSADVVVSGC